MASARLHRGSTRLIYTTAARSQRVLAPPSHPLRRFRHPLLRRLVHSSSRRGPAVSPFSPLRPTRLCRRRGAPRRHAPRRTRRGFCSQPPAETKAPEAPAPRKGPAAGAPRPPPGAGEVPLPEPIVPPAPPVGIPAKALMWVCMLAPGGWYYYSYVLGKDGLEKNVDRGAASSPGGGPLVEPDELTVDIPRPLIPRGHPFEKKPWWWRLTFNISRCLTLLRIFLPLIWLRIKHWWYSLENDKEARREFLDTMVQCFEDAGATWIKMGQWLSMRPDMVPPDMVQVLKKLQNESPRHSFAFTREVVEGDLDGRKIEGVFAEFAKEPVASGSIAQVYRAKVKKGTKLGDATFEKDEIVAVKVRHNSVYDQTYVDMKIIWRIMDIFLGAFGISFPFQEGELSFLLRRQLDLRWEGFNLGEFQRNFAGEEQILFPKVKFASEEVLVESWVDRGRCAQEIVDNFGLHLFKEGDRLTDEEREIVRRQEAGDF